MVSKSINLIFRAVQALLSFALLALLADIFANSEKQCATCWGAPPAPPRLEFAMFCVVFSLLSLVWVVYFVFYPMSRDFDVERQTANPDLDPRDAAAIAWFVGAGAVEMLNTIFFFSGAVAVAVVLGAHNCNNEEYTDSNPLTRGGKDTKRRCREAQAVTAFMFFAWLAWTATLLLPAWPRLFTRSGMKSSDHTSSSGTLVAGPMQAAPSGDEDAPPRYDGGPHVPINLRRFRSGRSGDRRKGHRNADGGPAIANIRG